MHPLKLPKNKILKYLFLVTRSLLLSAILVATFFKIPIPGTWAASVTWIGGTDSNWSTGANWSTGTVPTADDDVLIDVSGTINLTAGTTVKSLVLGNSSGTTTPILNFAHNGLVDIPGGNCVIERDFSTAHVPPCEEHEAGYEDENGIPMCADIISITCDPDIPGTFTIAGGNLHLYSGAQITHSAGTTAVVGAIKINITAGDAIIDTGATIDVTGMGYASSSGPGAGQSTGNGGGGGYGSSGGNGTGTSLGGVANGSISNPQNLGSGGGNGYGQNGTVLGGKGGGMVLINASGDFVNNGIIRANGTNANSTGTYLTQAAGGGSGGAVNITCNTFSGSGAISSNGGNSGYAGNSGYGGGGSGGRIAINYTSKTYTGTFESKGGIASTTGRDGGPGSIFTKATGTNGDLLYDNTGTADAFVGKGYVSFSSPETFDTLTLRNFSIMQVSSTVTVTGTLGVTTASTLTIESTGNISYGSLNWAATIIDNGGTTTLFASGTDLTVPSGATLVANTARTLNNITVNGTITGTSNSTSETYKINLTATGNLLISSTGTIDATGKGYIGSYGPGAGVVPAGGGNSGSGAGYAAYGGYGAGYGAGGGTWLETLPGGAPYGSITNPQNSGSGGGKGGSGGGIVLLNIGGTLTNNGSIKSNAGTVTSQGGGGGAGGTVNITCNLFEGNGTITANGGTGIGGGWGHFGGGGSGGRVAVFYGSKTYSGTITAKGGLGGTEQKDGGPGSIFTKSTGSNGDLVFDNTGTADIIDQKGYAKITTTETFDSLTVRNLSLLEVTSTVTITGALTVGTSSYLRVQPTANITESSRNWTGTILDYGGSILLSSDSRDLTVPNGGTYIPLDAAKTFRNGTIDGTITSLPNSTAETYKAILTFTGDVQISNTGNIDVTGKGYAKGYGPGSAITAPTNAYAGGGGAYGGGGGIGTLPTFIGGGPYGSITNPQNAGSGGLGGSASSGGGIILLSVTGTLTNNGNIKANGADGVRQTTAAGGGAGGTVNITCGTFAGNGLISSNGGNGSSSDWTHYGGGGGGGRIAVNYASKTFTGTINARGGVANTTGRDGGAGSIYMKASGTNGDLLYDNTGTQNTLVGKGITSITTTETFDNITVRNNSILDINSNITVTGDVSLSSNAYLRTGSSLNLSYSTFTWTLGTIVDNGGTIPLLANNVNFTVSSGNTFVANTQRTFNNIIVDGNITTTTNSTAETYKVNLIANGNFTISSTGNIDTTGLGYANGTGPGASTVNPTGGNAGGGGGYGGVGGVGNVATYLGGTTYGEISNPQNAGSGGKGAGGAGGSGGGIILLSVTGTLTNNGSIKSNGAIGAQVTTGSGGGAGGTVNITCNILAGSGVISANGGNAGRGDWGVYGGGGGGGRIAILTNTNNYLGTLSVTGGTGSNAGGFGTIYPDTLTIANTSATNVLEHSATISTEFTAIPINGIADTGFVWGTNSALGTIPQPTTAYYLNETDPNSIIDSIGGKNGTNTGSTVATGRIGNARSFDGASNYLTLPNVNNFNFGSNDFTISTWVYFTNVSKGYQMIIDRRGSSDQTGWILYLESNNALSFLSASSSGWDNTVLTSTGVVPTINTWSHIVITRNGNTFTMYLNGASIKTGTFTGSIGSPAVAPTVGKNHATPGSGVQGLIDNLAIYDKGLTSSTVSSLYNGGSGVESYSTANSISKSGTSTPKAISSDLTSLLSGTTYYFKPYATTTGGVAIYGDSYSFTTLGQSMELNSVTNILKDSATLSSDTTSIYKIGATDKGYIFGLDPTLQPPQTHAYYFDEAGSMIVDSVSGTNGTATGTSVTTGKNGNGRLFNGSSDYIIVPDDDSLSFTNAMTLEIWFKSSSTSPQVLFTKELGGSYYPEYQMILDAGRITATIYSGNSSGSRIGIISPLNTYANGQWHHAVSTYNGSLFSLYIDGVSVASTPTTVSLWSSVNPLGIGVEPGTKGSKFNGTLDDFRIYNVAYSASQIADLYNNVNSLSKISKGSISSTAGAFLTTDLSELTPLTTYYFKPYILYNGIYYYGDIASFTTLADNFVPTASKDNISGVADIYAGKTLDIVTRYSDADGIADLDKLYLQIKNPAGTNIEYYANASESNQTGQTPTSVSGSEYISNITYDLSVNSPDTNDITVTWHVTPNWNWTRDTSIQYGVKTLDKKAAESTYDYTVATYKYENRLTFTGTLVARDYNNNVLTSGDWTKPNSTVNFTGLRVVYAGTTDVYPNDIDFDARVTNSEASFWDDYTSVGRDISINATTVDATNASDTYTFSIPEIPNGGQDVSNVTFIIKTDKTSPVISSLTSSTHPDSNTWYTATTATFNWTITDADSGLQGVWYLLNNSADTTSEEVETNGTNTSSNGVTITNITNNTWYLHLIAKDNIGNTSSNVHSFKIDSGTPNIVNVTGLYNNVWQNVDAGPVISWTDPNSTSDDTFYITNDGTIPTPTNYTYTTTSNTYDLPNQSEGQTTITVRALNGAGVYSISRTFLVNYDNTVPVISSLTSSTHPDSDIWYTTTTATLSWTISETYSGIQNTWYLLDNNSNTSNADVMSNGTEISNSSITIAGITSNTWYFHLTTKDNAGNISSSVYSFKIDSPVPNIVEVTGLYNNVWQSEDAGPVISWTDPNSTSGDTFYITNDGTTPTSTNYTYTTTSNTYDLPSQTEGQTTITVRDLNGAGIYSVARTFIIKYDNTAPIISTLSSSTHPDSNIWYSSNIATINWTINDNQSGIYKVWRLVDQIENTTATQVMENGTEDQAVDSTQITLAADGTWYFHIVAIDNKGISTIGTFKINIDTQAPSNITVSSTTHPNQVAWYSNNVAEIAWNFTDSGSGVEGVWRLLTQDITKTSNEILNNGTQALANTSWTTAALTDGIWHLHLTAKDNMGNTLSTKYTLQIDSSTPDIVGITGANNNVLQNVENGPIISWTYPNSISGDTFYITNDGTTPTSSNYTYTTTSNTFDLPSQKEGETTISVRALNGAGTYSETKAFIIKYDSLAPANVSNFTSSATTNTVTLSWINPTASDFSKVILIKNSNHIPTSLTDGTKIYEGTNITYTDINLNEGTRYYYTIFTFDTIENMSSGAITQITTNTTPVVTPPSTPQTQTPTTPVVTPPTPVVTEPIVPPITNNTKVVKSQDLVEEKKLNITVDSKQAIETRVGDLHVYPEQVIQIEIPAKTIKDEVADIRQVVLTLDNEAYNLTYNSESDTYRATISAPSIKGAYDTTIATISTDANNSFTITMSLLVDPYGYVYSVSSNGGENRILNAKISLYTKQDGLEILLKTTDGTNNPQYTDIQGEYQFFVAPGEYKLVVEAQGYIPTETEWFTVDKNIIEKNIEIKKNPYLLYCGIAIVEIAAGFFLVILQRKKRKNRKRYVKPI